MNILTVDLNSRSYPIYIGRDIIGDTQLYRPHIAGSKVMIVTNETIAPLYAARLSAALAPIAEVAMHILGDGEIYKNLDTVTGIFDALIDATCDRKTTLIALGGGVVGDIAGFAAACYQRGIPYIQVPTTLLAQVDSSVGGKTGVNHARGKNMIGAFNQPQCVVCDTHTLATLPQREVNAGIAEVIKYGIIRDQAFFDWLDREMEPLTQRNAECLAYAIEQSCRNKAEVVAKDERESGIRAILNFGHTFGHAIETRLGYKDWLHGEAVGAGMILAAAFSQDLGMLKKHQAERIRHMIARAQLPTAPPHGMTVEDFLSAMAHDKKVENQIIRLILLNGIGNAVIKDDYPPAQLAATIDRATRA